MSTTTYTTADEFYEYADSPEYVLLDGKGQNWLAWGTEDGDWYACRPAAEDDEPRPDDEYRPIGPVSLDDLPEPWTVFALLNLTHDEAPR